MQLIFNIGIKHASRGRIMFSTIQQLDSLYKKKAQAFIYILYQVFLDVTWT